MGTGLFIEGLAAVRNERTLFSGLDLRLAAGEAMMLSGPNGIGKTTLLRMIAGLIAPAAGRITLEPSSDDCEILQRSQLVGARDPLKSALNVAELLASWRDVVFAEEAPADPVGPALAALDLSALTRVPCGYLSSGQRRRVSLARLCLSTVTHRPLWLLDEPTNALDQAARLRLAELVAAHRAQGGMVLAASHDPLEWPDLRQLNLGTLRTAA